jgi:hypothetical protein
MYLVGGSAGPHWVAAAAAAAAAVAAVTQGKKCAKPLVQINVVVPD